MRTDFTLPRLTPAEAQEHCAALADSVADLLEWSATVGDWEAPCWSTARERLDRLRDLRDAQAQEATHGQA